MKVSKFNFGLDRVFPQQIKFNKSKYIRPDKEKQLIYV